MTGSIKISYLKEYSNECRVNQKGRSFTTHIRPSFKRAKRAQNQICTKKQLGDKQGLTKLLCVPWDKREDTIFNPDPNPVPDPITKATKREVFAKIAKIYDPLGLPSQTSLEGKFLYKAVYEAWVPWDKELPQELEIGWQTW